MSKIVLNGEVFTIKTMFNYNDMGLKFYTLLTKYSKLKEGVGNR